MRIWAIGTMVAMTSAGMVAAQAPAPVAAKPATAEKLICHREEVTGSLAGSRKTCLTKAQWEAQARASQEAAERMLDQGRVTSCGATTLGGC